MNIFPKLYKLSYSIPSLPRSRSLASFSPTSFFSTTKPLPSTQFSRQLGLQTQLQKFSKQQQKNQNSTYRSSAIMVIGLLTAVGTYAIVQLVDSQLQLIRLYKVTRGYLKLKHLGKQNKEQVLSQLEERYINCLYKYYQKNYRDRSYVDGWFVRKLIELVTQSQQVNNPLILDVVACLSDKLQSGTRSSSVILELVQWIIYNRSNTIKNQQLLTTLCVNLLKYGTLTQQYLGLRTLKNRTKLTARDLSHSLSRLLLNKQQLQTQLQTTSPLDNHKLSQLELKITTVKQKLFYQIDQLRITNRIKVNKVNVMEEILGGGQK